jgi:hypothetical protein
MSTSLLRMETLTSQPVKVKDTQLRLHSRVIQLRFPFLRGGVIWNRPVAVWVRTADGRDQTLPIQDVTRTAVLALLAFSLAVTFLFMLFRRRSA